MEGTARERRWDGTRGALLAIGPVALTAGLRPLLGRGDVLLVVPPFAGIDRPSLGAHLLQACALAAGFAVDVFYANLDFAERIGERAYEAIAWAPTRSLVGERVFARAAYGAPRFGRNRASVQPSLDQVCAVAGMTPGDLSEIERATGSWATEMAQAISSAGYRLVGCSTTFEQTAASVALLDRVKRVAPATITALGGANCDGPMGEGLLSLGRRRRLRVPRRERADLRPVPRRAARRSRALVARRRRRALPGPRCPTDPGLHPVLRPGRRLRGRPRRAPGALADP